MNYLALQALHEVGTRPDTTDLYTDGIFLIDLRCARRTSPGQGAINLQRTPPEYNRQRFQGTLITDLVCWCFLIDLQEYERTGYVWEQYDANTGEGRRRCVNW